MTRKYSGFVRSKLQAAVIVACVCIVAFCLGTSFLRFNTDPVQEIARNTARLHDATERLEASLDLTTPTDRVTRRYLTHLSNIKTACAEIEKLSTDKKLLQNATAQSIARSSTALCKDLLVLAEDSEKVYRPARALLSIDTKVKRYQTLPLVSNHLRQKHASVIATVATELGGTSDQSNGYPFSATTLVKQVQQNHKNSPKLTYLPALHRAQIQLLAERQQYWTAYGDIADLNRELEVQMSRYCSLPELDNNPTLCKDSNK